MDETIITKAELYHILMIDDVSQDVEYLSVMLKKKGNLNFEHRQVVTPDELETALLEREWDVILCDFLMSLLKPERAIELAQKLQPSTPILLVSGVATVQDAVDMMRLGARAFIEKNDDARLIKIITHELEATRRLRRAFETEATLDELLNTMKLEMSNKYIQLEQFFSISIDLLCITDNKGNFLKVNKAWENLLGYPAKELEGRAFLDFIYPDDLKMTIAKMNEPPHNNNPNNFINRYHAHDGSYRYIEWHSKRYGNIFYAVARDITERIQNTNRQRAILSAIPDLMFCFRISDDTFVDYHTPSESMLKVLPEHFIGKRLQDVLPSEIASKYLEAKARVVATRQPTVHEYTWLLEGKAHYHESRLVLAGEDEILAIVREITDEKLAEREILIQNAILHQSQDLIALSDIQGNITFMNQGGATMVGVPDSELLIGKPIAYFHLPEDAERTLNEYLPYAIGTGLWQGENRLRTFDGELIDVFQTIFPIKNKQGKIIQLASFMSDITLRKQAEGALHKQALLQQTLVKISSTFITLQPYQLDDVINSYLGELGTILQADRFYIFEYDFERQVTTNTHEWSAEGIEPTIDTKQDVPLSHFGDWAVSHIQGNFVNIPDTSALPSDDVFRQILEADGIKSTFAVPLMDGDTCLGSLGVDMIRAHHTYTEAEIHLLTIFAQILVNVRKRLATLAELQENQRFLAGIIENSGSLIYVKDLDGKYQKVNRKWEEVTGFTRDFMLNKTDDVFFKPDESQTYRENDLKVISSGKLLETEELLHTDENTRYFISVKFPMLDNKGEIMGVCGISTEITRRKHAEIALQEAYGLLEVRVIERTTELERTKNRLEAIFNHSGDGIMLLSVDEGIQHANEAFNQMFKSADNSYLGMGLTSFFHPDDIDTIQTTLEAVVTSHQSRYIEACAKRADQTIFNAEISIAPVNPSAEAIASLVCIIRDITERKQSEEALYQALAREKELSELKSRFVGMFSHDFRNPLSSILASSGMLRKYEERLTSERKQEHYQRIEGSVQQLLQMLDDMLVVTEMESGYIQFSPENMNLSAFVQSLVGEFQLIDQNKHTLSFQTTLYEDVEADPKLLRHIVANLLSNAIKYSAPHTEVAVSISATEYTIIIEVQDQGVGIPEDSLDKVFDPFHRADNVKETKGTGLGLSILKECIDQHQGQIEIESKLGEGTRFIVTLRRRY